MIIDFRCKGTEDLYEGVISKDALQIPQTIWKSALRKLDMLESAHSLEDLKVLPGNRLEALKSELAGKFSIRINDQYRIVFKFEEGNASEVEIMDYH